MSVPGVGPIISTAMVAAIGTGEAFERGRDFGAWLGLVPRQYSTGGRRSSGASPSAAADTCARSSSRRPRCSDAPAELGEVQLRRMAEGGAAAHASQQAGRRARQQARPHRLERAEHNTAFDAHRVEIVAIYRPTSTRSSRLRTAAWNGSMRRAQSLMAQMVVWRPVR